ncbi:hypothetical protein [Mycobacterium simiae]|uniref:hypothetical protein n=1 Tax=Mycobacterium simiae TaxID=1784 RepID=UPI002616EDBC|nr:hypothetical protein [Mycobacterium simiae]
MLAALAFALLVTLAIAIAGWFRPLPVKSPMPAAYNPQEIAEAHAKVCAAYQSVHNAIKASTSRDRGAGPNERLIFAINGQQALLAGSVYLRSVLSQQPAAPYELANAVQQLTDLFQELVVEYQNNLSETEEAPAVRATDATTVKIERLCA